MKWLTKEKRAKLLANGRRHAECERKGEPCDLVPETLLHFYGSSWLLTMISPDDPDLAFGLCHLYDGHPELGFVRLSELAELRDDEGRGVHEDALFKTADRNPLSQYLSDVEILGQIPLSFTTSVQGDVSARPARKGTLKQRARKKAGPARKGNGKARKR